MQVTPVPGEFVFAHGDQCLSMYFVVTGQMRYASRVPVRHGSTDDCMHAERLGANKWVSEAVLWTEWTHCGDFLGLADCSLFALLASKFANVINQNPLAHLTACVYAIKFVVALNFDDRTF